ncbi:glycosyltransferase family 71 protein [Hyaloscypha variabilis F]|uniref:Glycosyltransferase family 71 protein n=1 Tax=Hyaloscypha variabilis (strain UAMH 11265 / GT02V1 / F) TaxID=1149755 RepID=A0A2J6RFK6_HYAVF|nr:glycosyltransferase family 71 protein [Hyaloscypha variabilis F]
MRLKSHFGASRRSRILVLLSIFVVIGLAFSYYHTIHSISGLIPEFKSPSSIWTSKPPKPSKFWLSFAPLLGEAAPNCPPPERQESTVLAKNRFYNERWILRLGGNWLVDEVPFPNQLKMKRSDVQSMREKHSLFVDLLNTKAPTLDYEKGTKGIVTSAGGSYFPDLIISLLMLRRSGSTLPVEVFLTTPSEYEPQICESILPYLNAKCIILSDILSDTPHGFTIQKFQIKIFAMLFSSFESLLFLDADNFPIHPPEELFSMEPFTKNHLVLWPDFWTSTASPIFPDIVGLSPDILRTRPTIESGQILVSKKHHAKTLLLAAYYNVYGDYFYPLISQGGPGEGDKDTFAPAALVLNNAFYTVETPPVNLGIRNVGGSAIVHYDPSIPYPCPAPSPGSETCEARAFFIHASWSPKLNALQKLQSTRKWGDEKKNRQMFGMDVEKVVWGYMVEVACNDWEFADWGNGNKTATPVCAQSKKCFRDVFGDEWDGVMVDVDKKVQIGDVLT